MSAVIERFKDVKVDCLCVPVRFLSSLMDAVLHFVWVSESVSQLSLLRRRAKAFFTADNIFMLLTLCG